MKFTCTINMDNAAFGDAPEFELTDILTKIIHKIRDGYVEGFNLDTNGNKVGKWEIETD